MRLVLLLMLATTMTAGCDSSSSPDEASLSQTELSALSARFDCRVAGVTVGQEIRGQFPTTVCDGVSDLYAFRVTNTVRLDITATSDINDFEVIVQDSTGRGVRGLDYNAEPHRQTVEGLFPPGVYILDIEGDLSETGPYSLKVAQRTY